MPGRSSSPGSLIEPIRIVMVEASPLLATGLREIFDRESDIELVGEAGSPEAARQMVDATAPDVVLIDVSTEAPSGSRATRRLRRESPGAAFVVLGGHDDDASIIEAVEIGARGHISDVAQPAELVEIIRRVAYGDDPLQEELRDRPDLLARVEEDREAPAPIAVEPNPLTPREIEVLQLAAQGLKNREIAERFVLAEQSVKNHLRAVMRKLGAPNRTQAVLTAMRHQWLPGPEAIEER